MLTSEVIRMKRRKRDTETESAKRKWLSLARSGIQNEKEITEMAKEAKGNKLKGKWESHLV